MTRGSKRLSVLIAVLLLVIVLVADDANERFDEWLARTPDVAAYPVTGTDVSSYQGDIDWPLFAKNGFTFAFIKATEGSSHVDDKFAYNWQQAHKTKLAVGAYHFFSFDSSGATQAANYIKQVPKVKGALPPVVDLEFYGQYSRFNAPDAEAVRTELKVMLDALEAHYGVCPIIYTSKRPYEYYIKGHFDDYRLWLTGYHEEPDYSAGEWTFWQYSERGELSGYSGFVRQVDLNVYRGSAADFKEEFGQ